MSATGTSGWQAGVGVRDITPAAGSLMACFPTQPNRTPRRATGAHDSCLTKALVLSNGSTEVAICSIDVTMINAVDVRLIRDAVEKEVPELARERVILAATHTHSSPETSYLFGNTPEDPWIQTFRAQVTEAIVDAHRRLEPAKVGLSVGEANLNFNRRFIVDGVATMIRSEPESGGEGPTDPTLAVLRVERLTGGPIAAVVHYTAHPLVIGPGSFLFSADYPGVLRQHMESKIGGGETLFVNGAAGNIHPKIATGLDWDEVDRMGTRLADAALDVYAQATSDLEPTLSVESTVLRFPNRIDPQLEIPIEIGVLRLGDAVFAVVPGEFFVEFQLALREASHFPKTFMIGFTNDSIGYVPNREAYEFGGYGVEKFEGDPAALNRTRVPPGAGEVIVERLVSMINSEE